MGWKRHAGEDDQGQRHGGLAEDDEGNDDLDRGDEELFRAVVRELGDVEQVVGDAAHDEGRIPAEAGIRI